MCISPSYVWQHIGPKYEQIPVPCKLCWSCKENRVNDYVARALAESSVSAHTCTITLTYAPRDDLADRVLHPQHFQLFMKRLRFAGHKVRYLVAGEYGKLKGRAHFHALLFFTEIVALPEGLDPPAYNSPSPFCRQIPHDLDLHISEWPHGHVRVDWSASEKAARYVCKYLLSDEKHNAWFSLSKKPALGAEWFARKAALGRELGVMPHGFEYMPPGGDKKKKYLMTGATRRDFLRASAPVENSAALDPWAKLHKLTPERARLSEWARKSYDKWEKAHRIKTAVYPPWEDFVEAYLEHRAGEFAANTRAAHKMLWDEAERAYYESTGEPSEAHFAFLSRQAGVPNDEKFKDEVREALGFWSEKFRQRIADSDADDFAAELRGGLSPEEYGRRESRRREYLLCRARARSPEELAACGCDPFGGADDAPCPG